MAMVVTLATLVTLLSILFTPSCGRTLVGGKTEITDVKTNMQVQELGKFAVEEYNKGLMLRLNDGSDDGREEKLEFVEVVEAEHQVVAGVKYYLKISATLNGVHRMFTSVVVVKPWLHSKKLLNFGPSTSISQ